MKTAVFHPFLDNIGGAETVALTLARELPADIYTTNIDREKVMKMGFEDVLPRIHSIGRVPASPPFRQQMVFLKFRYLNLKNKYDFFIIAGDWAIPAAVNNKPNLGYIHSALNEIWACKDKVDGYLKPWEKPINRLWLSYIRFFYVKYFRHLERLVCNSKNTQNRIKQHLNQTATIIYPPIDTFKYNFRENKNFWLSVNRLIFHKRIALQLKAFSKLSSEKLVVVGSYEKKVRHFKKYKQYLQSICPNNVSIIHWAPKKDLLKFYAECKGLIATAMDEDFGMTAVEAMAAGKPVVAPDEGGYKETVIDGLTGILIKDINEEKLIEAVKLAGKDPEKYKEACLKQAQKFDTGIFMEKIKKEIALSVKKDCEKEAKVLFLSHMPHKIHLDFAKTLKARINIIPYGRLSFLSKRIRILSWFYPLFSLILSLFIKVKENILLVDGGTSLGTAAFMKLFNKNIKIVYLDADMYFYNISRQNRLIRMIKIFFGNKIDAVISVSEQNKQIIQRYTNVPTRRCNIYPVTVDESRNSSYFRKPKRKGLKRKNYGLYAGRLDPDKNITRIIRFALQCPYFDKFIIAGDGAYKNYIKEISSKKNKILYLGWIKNMFSLYKQCRFLIHIPDYDPHPCVPMEAALAGCFPIISKGTGLGYLFDDIFIIKEPDNFNNINERICYINKRPEEIKMLLAKAIKKFPQKEESQKIFQQAFGEILTTF